MENPGTKEIIRRLSSMDHSLERIAKALEQMNKVNNRQGTVRQRMVIDPISNTVLSIDGDDETDSW